MKQPKTKKKKAGAKAPAQPTPANAGDDAILRILEDAACAPLSDDPQEHGAPPDDDGKARRRRPPQRDSLMALTTTCNLWHSPQGGGYVTFTVKGHRQSWPIRSQQFRRWLASRAYEETGLVPGAQATEDTLRVLEARAYNEGPCRAPWLRVGREGGKAWLDLCDDHWRAVEISRGSWRIVEKPASPFVRTSGMLQLPEPEGGADINELRRFLNVGDDESFVLACAWLVTALADQGEYPILVLGGEQGSGKSTAARLLRSLVDPNHAPIRSIPKDERDLIVSCMNGHVIALDNLSKVDQILSDGLCRISTGGGFATRQLHTDADELLFSGSRPIILNGIPLLTDKADLADRSINIRLRSIPDHERRPEADFWQEWAEVRPRVLGALLDAFARGLAEADRVKSDWFPRMASFAKWAMGTEPGFGWEPGTFRAAYSSNRSEAAAATFEADPVANAIVAMITSPGVQGRWEGSAADLLASLADFATDAVKRSRRWPQSPQGVGNALDRAGPLLRTRGVHFERHKSGVRTITIWRKAE